MNFNGLCSHRPAPHAPLPPPPAEAILDIFRAERTGCAREILDDVKREMAEGVGRVERQLEEAFRDHHGHQDLGRLGRRRHQRRLMTKDS